MFSDLTIQRLNESRGDSPSDRPTKNALEKKWIDQTREKTANASDLELLQKTFDRMK